MTAGSAYRHGEPARSGAAWEVPSSFQLPNRVGTVDVNPSLGIPVDSRRPSQRERASRSANGDFEPRAARVIARTLGQRVELVDHGSRDSLVDIHIRYDNGKLGVVEVVTDTDNAWAASYSAIFAREFSLCPDGLERIWHLALHRQSKLGELETAAATLLAKLEALRTPVGQVTLVNVTDPDVDASIRRLVKLGVARLYSRLPQTDESSAIHLTPEGAGGYPEADWGRFNDQLNQIVRSDRLADVRRKLATGDADERHIFLATNWSSSWALNYWLKAEITELPDQAPNLPDPISHLWLWSLVPGKRALVWCPQTGWFNPQENWATP